MCSKAVSISVGFSDHNLVAIVRKSKVPKVGPKVLFQRSLKSFCKNEFIGDINKIQWDKVCSIKHVDKALELFTEMFLEVADKHAPIRKFTVRNRKAPWIDDQLKALMTQRDKMGKGINKTDWKSYCSLRNQVTKVNRKKKSRYYQNRINEIKNDGKKLWKTLNDIMGRSGDNSPSFLESDGTFIRKPHDIANYLNEYFVGKIETLKNEMTNSDNKLSKQLINDYFMKNKDCKFYFQPVQLNLVEKLLLNLNGEKPSGLDNMDGKLLGMVSGPIALPICHIFNLSLQEGVFPQAWKAAKVIPLPKNKNEVFRGANSRPISILPLLSKLLERLVFDQITHYFSVNELNSDFQHAYKKGHSTSTALMQMTDQWLSDIDRKRIVGAVLLDFSAAFD